MQFKYFPHTEEDKQQMLNKAGSKTMDDLFNEIPDAVKLKGDYNLPDAKSEIEIRSYFDELCQQNSPLTVFAGSGAYDHYNPAVIPHLLRRAEFLTSYTPYQAEVSQGTLHYIFEFQSMMAELTGMEVANASMYDGATATAESVLMADASAKNADTVLLSETVDPKILDVIKTYAHYNDIKLEFIPHKDGVTDRQKLEERINQGGVSGVVVQQPNYYGIIEDYDGVSQLCHDHKALCIMNYHASNLGLLKTPSEYGADIAVGEAQSLGIPLSYGGPYLGYLCCTQKLVRRMPGRIVGKTQDANGKRVFVLTLQAREQHIRRQKATSNICSNQSLMSLYVTIYLSLMGKQGLKEVAQKSYDGAHYLYEQLIKTGHFKPTFDQPFFNEFCVEYDGDVKKLQKELLNENILAGVHISGQTIMFAVTEMRTKAEIDKLVDLIKK